jgi:rod shape-determining protein MreC
MASAGVILTRSGRSAVTKGDGAGRIVVQYVPAIADVVPGEPVVTSGADGVYPKDIPLGTIETVRGGGPSIFLDLPVKPYSDPQTESLVFVLPPLPAMGAPELAPLPETPAKGPEKARRPSPG